MRLTITEALADIKTSLARIDKKQKSILGYLGRDSRLRDPLEKEGGSAEFIKRERQSILDLQDKIVRVRSAIQKINLETTLTIEGETRTLAAWLNWRREIAGLQQTFLSQMSSNIHTLRQQATRQGATVRESGETSAAPQDFIINMSESALATENERMTTILGQLDGKLSLLNATTLIEV
jgi:hypothetical protein